MLDTIRSPRFSSRQFLTIFKPVMVFSGRVNQPDGFTTVDAIRQIPYDGATGDYTNVLADMTVLVGTTAGGSERGICRARGATATDLLIGPVSEIAFQDNDYITVIRDFRIWSKPMLAFGGVYQADGVTSYSDQHSNFDPAPVLGPIACALWLQDGSAELVMDAGDSWVIGSTISGYSWSAAGPAAVVVTGPTTATPLLEFDTAGQYLVTCTVTAANGKIATGRRWVAVYDAENPPVNNFTLTGDPVGDWERGGWQFEVELYDEAALDDVQDGALVLLWSEDRYDSALTGAGYDSVIAVGWIAGESIRWARGGSAVEFQVQGPHYFMDKLEAMAANLTDTAITATTWLQIPSMTVDRAIWHHLHHRSTISSILDIRLTGDTRRLDIDDGSVGSLWGQMQSLASKILARPACDRYGRLYVEIDVNLLPVADRSGIETVQAIQAGDVEGGISITVAQPRVARVETSGYAWSGTLAMPFWSRSPGRVYGRKGQTASRDYILVKDQAQLNELTGLLMGKENNPYPRVDIPLGQLNRLHDIIPQRYVTLSVQASDTPRKIVWINQKLIVRRVEGLFAVDLECEAETQPYPAVKVIPPSTPNDNWSTPDPGLPESEPLVPPNNPYFPPTDTIPGDPGGGGDSNPPPTSECVDNINAPPNGPYSVGLSGTVYNAGPTRTTYGSLPCYVRSFSHEHPTIVYMAARFQKLVDDVWVPMSTAELSGLFTLSVVYGGSAIGTVSLSGTLDSTGYGVLTGTISFPSSTRISSFKLEVTGESKSNYYIYGDPLTSGSVAGNNSVGVQLPIALPTGGLYAVQGTEGPFNSGPAGISYALRVYLGSTKLAAAGWGAWLGIYSQSLHSYPAVHVEQVEPESYYGRIFFYKISNDMYIKVSDDSFHDNTGSIGYIIYAAGVYGDKRIIVNSINVYNICGLI